MLILAGKENSGFQLQLPNNELIDIYVMGVHGNQVKIGFDAPGHVNIIRHSLMSKAKRDNLRIPNVVLSSTHPENQGKE